MHSHHQESGIGLARLRRPVAIVLLATLGVVSALPFLNAFKGNWSRIAKFSNPAGKSEFEIYQRNGEPGLRRHLQIWCVTSGRIACEGWIESDNGPLSVPVRWSSDYKGQALIFLHPYDAAPQWVPLAETR